MTKITRTTIKNFINKNIKHLYIKNLSHFDGMIDGTSYIEQPTFKPTFQATDNLQYNLGAYGAWFVGNSRDYFKPYADDQFIGYEVYNCCGSFILAIKQSN